MYVVCVLVQIAQCTCNPEYYEEVMSQIWRRVQEEGLPFIESYASAGTGGTLSSIAGTLGIGSNSTTWRRVYKTLVLLHYLLLHGSERVVDSIRAHSYEFRRLQEHFAFVDVNGRDQGINGIFALWAYGL